MTLISNLGVGEGGTDVESCQASGKPGYKGTTYHSEKKQLLLEPGESSYAPHAARSPPRKITGV